MGSIPFTCWSGSSSSTGPGAAKPSREMGRPRPRIEEPARHPTLLQLGGRLVESTPKSRAGERILFHTAGQEPRSARPGVPDDDLSSYREDGAPYAPD